MKKISLYAMSILYFLAGAYHFINPKFYKQIMPGWLPYQNELIYLSGITELILAMLLLYPNYRRTAAWMIIVMLLVFLPVHLQMLFDNPSKFDIPVFVLVARVFVQFLLIAWAYSFTKVEK